MTGIAPRVPESSGVRIPPPLIYLSGFLVGVALEQAFPVGSLPLACTLTGALIGGVLWLALDGTAMLRFRRAGTSMVPTKPTTAFVTSGPFTRAPTK
jgi:hypothetical protein